VACRLLFCLLLVPALARAQAEPAPPEYVPPGHEKPPPPPSPLKWRIGADARVTVPLREPKSLPPVGWGAGAQVTRALVDVRRARIGIGVDFGYARISASQVHYPDYQEHLAHMTFAALGVLDAIVGHWRPWFAVGVGFSVAWYFQPHGMALPPTDVNTVVPLVPLEAGVSYDVYRGIDIGIVAHLDLTFSSQSLGTPGFTVFDGGIFAPRLQIGFRF
jgi:hypothetical protein